MYIVQHDFSLGALFVICFSRGVVIASCGEDGVLESFRVAFSYLLRWEIESEGLVMQYLRGREWNKTRVGSTSRE